MSVQEIIEQIRGLDPAARRQVREALEAWPDRDPAAVAAGQRRLEEVWALLDEGWCTTGGKNLSEGIDEALYGGEE